MIGGARRGIVERTGKGYKTGVDGVNTTDQAQTQTS
jgi:hypothetical protein